MTGRWAPGDARPTLDKLADLITAQNPPTIAIEGHTDSKGDDAAGRAKNRRVEVTLGKAS